MTGVSAPTRLRPFRPDDSRSSDCLLVHQVVGGDDAALEAICARYRPRLNTYVRRLVPDAPVDEITQDVFVRFWSTATRFDPERGSLSAFLHVTARGKAFDWARSEAARRQREDSYGRDVDGSQEDGGQHDGGHHDGGRHDGGEVELDIRCAVASLPLKERRAIWLAYYLGYTYREVAIVLDIPEGTAKAQLRAALRRLRLFVEANPPMSTET